MCFLYKKLSIIDSQWQNIIDKFRKECTQTTPYPSDINLNSQKLTKIAVSFFSGLRHWQSLIRSMRTFTAPITIGCLWDLAGASHSLASLSSFYRTCPAACWTPWCLLVSHSARIHWTRTGENLKHVKYVHSCCMFMYVFVLYDITWFNEKEFEMSIYFIF